MDCRPADGRPTALLVLAALCSGCSLLAPFSLDELPPVDPDAAADGAPDAADADVPVDADRGDGDADVDPCATDGDGPPTPGPLTAVVQSVQVLTERLHDLDGNGSSDNAAADLGSPAGELFAMALTTHMQAQIDSWVRVVLHLPRVDDLGTACDRDAALIVCEGEDLDEPTFPGDDFEGGEPFAVLAKSLDGCGEPRHAFPHARVALGTLEASGGSLPLPATDHVRGLRAVVEGLVGTEGMDLVACAVYLTEDLGDEMPATDMTGDLTMLEVLLAGGAGLGMPFIPGLAPDVDLDGDGLESFELGPDSHLASCLDGDGATRIEGRDCWSDPRIADGFSLTLRLVAVPATFAGRAPGWEDAVEGPCPGGPPAVSLFDPR